MSSRRLSPNRYTVLVQRQRETSDFILFHFELVFKCHLKQGLFIFFAKLHFEGQFGLTWARAHASNDCPPSLECNPSAPQTEATSSGGVKPPRVLRPTGLRGAVISYVASARPGGSSSQVASRAKANKGPTLYSARWTYPTLGKRTVKVPVLTCLTYLGISNINLPQWTFLLILYNFIESEHCILEEHSGLF